MSTLLDNAIAIVNRPEMEPIQESVTPMGLLQVAMSQNADIDKLTKLMELQERWEANEARKAFNAAFSAFKAEAVTIVKGTDVKAGPLAGTKYANLFDVVNAVIPALSKHGLSHSWKLSKDDPAWMEITCTIRHILGHSESVAMGAAPDVGPGRNAIQARGSAKSYLERYTLLAATGMAASGTDNDGNTIGGGKELDIAEFDRVISLIESADSLSMLQVTFIEGYKAAQKVNDTAAMKQFTAAKDKRKAELNENN
jgi:hypothetical protein